MNRTTLIDTLTPGDTPFQVHCDEDPSGIEVISFEGPTVAVRGSEQEAVQAGVALLYRYAPDALDHHIVDGLDEGDQIIEVQTRKGSLIDVPVQVKPDFVEL